MYVIVPFKFTVAIPCLALMRTTGLFNVPSGSLSLASGLKVIKESSLTFTVSVIACGAAFT